MNRQQLFEQIRRKRSFLCVGLDSDIEKIPHHLLDNEDPVFEFNKQIIDATHDLAVAYKPNTAFYEARGTEGWRSLERTAQYIRQSYPDLFVIADAKRGDIGNTSAMYAATFFSHMPMDAVTLSPYMGADTVSPFLKFEGKWSILLALTSNPSAADLQYFEGADESQLYEHVLRTASNWGSTDQIMFVVGATKAEAFEHIRKIIPDHFLLVPGIGAQGGSLEAVAQAGLNDHCGLLVNSSRGIIFASSDDDFALSAREQAHLLQQEMEVLLRDHRLI